MFKLVVFSCVVALAAANANYGGAYSYAAPAAYPAAYGYAAPALAAAPVAAKILAPAAITPAATYAAPAVAYSAPAVAYAAPAPAVAYAAPAPAVAYAAPAPAVVAVKPAVTYTAPQQVGTEVQKTVHVAPVPQVTGYTQTIHKPDLGLVATPPFQYAQTPVLAEGRKVQTIIPQETRVEPEVHVQRMPYDVPVPKPYVGEVELRTPVVQGPTPVVHEKVAVPGAPIVAPAKVAVHDIPTPVAAAPAIPYAAAPAVPYAAAPAVPYAAAPAVPYAAAPIAAKVAYAGAYAGAYPTAYAAGAYPAAYSAAYPAVYPYRK